MTCSKFARFLLVSLAALAAPPLVPGAIIDKANNALDLDQPESWVGGVLPTNLDVIRWSNIVTGANTVGGQISTGYKGIIVTDPGGTVTLSQPGGVNLYASGIDMSAATQDLVIATSLKVWEEQTWRVAPGRKITLQGPIHCEEMPHLIGGTVEMSFGSPFLPGHFTVGGTADNPGLLNLNSPLSSPVIFRMNGTGLVINPFGTARLAGSFGDQIFDSTGVSVAGGTFDLNGHTETIGKLDGTADGVITNSSATTAKLIVTDTVGSSQTFAGRIESPSGQVNFEKTGNGTLILSGASDFRGVTRLWAGTLVVTGSLDRSTMVISGGTVAGDGLIRSMLTGGKISPGVGGPATLKIGDDLIFRSGTTLTLELNGTALESYDRLSVVDTVTFEGNPVLDLILGYIPDGDSFTIIDNLGASPVLGTGLFTVGGNPLSEGESFKLGGYDANISYVGGDGNDVVITVPEPGAVGLLVFAGAVGCVRRRRRNG